VQRFIRNQNLTILRRQLAEATNETKRRQILRLLAEEEEEEIKELLSMSSEKNAVN
jgi:DNA-binding transcriptional ArsR family regulator